MLFLIGCISIQDSNYAMYSRDDVKTMLNSNSFGSGRNDDIYVALSHIYNDDEISEKCGGDFEVLAENIVCHFSEGENFLFYGIYKGHAEYSILIKEYSYRIKLSKDYFKKWSVVDCFLENEEIKT